MLHLVLISFASPDSATEPVYWPLEGVWAMTVNNQDSSSCLQVLLPDAANTSWTKRKQTSSLPLLLALPVEQNVPGFTDDPKKDRAKYGNGLEEIKKANFHNEQGYIVASMSFPHTPWFADNLISNGSIMQEKFILATIIPILQQQFNISKEIKLIGFSKSGWGALTLLSRYPSIFRSITVWQ